MHGLFILTFEHTDRNFLDSKTSSMKHDDDIGIRIVTREFVTRHPLEDLPVHRLIPRGGVRDLLLDEQ